MLCSGHVAHDRGERYEWRRRQIGFYTGEAWLKHGDGPWVKLAVPDDMEVATFADQALLSPRSEYTCAAGTFAAGALLALPVAG